MVYSTKILEQPAYKIVQTDRKIELRDYDSMLLQLANVSGQQYDGLRKGFRPLVNSIGAKVREGEKILMTAPVMQSLGDDENAWSVSFSMAKKFKISELSKPNNERIYTQVIPAFCTAVFRFSGRADMSLLAQKRKNSVTGSKAADHHLVQSQDTCFAMIQAHHHSCAEMKY